MQLATFPIDSQEPEPQAELTESRPKAELAELPVRQPLGPGAFPGIRRPFRALWWTIQVVIGIGFLVPLLAGLAALPGLNLVSLGMLLNAEREVGNSGRLRDGFPLLPISARLGTIGIMVGLGLIPIFMLASLEQSYGIIRELSQRPVAATGTIKFTVQVAIFAYLLLAVGNGGSVRSFFWPLRPGSRRFAKVFTTLAFVVPFLLAVLSGQGGVVIFVLPLLMLGAAVQNAIEIRRAIKLKQYWSSIDHYATEIFDVLKPWEHLKLAFKGAVGALCWLVVPTLLLGVSSSRPYQEPGLPALASFMGGALLIPVAAWLPLLQCHQAATGRFGAIFEIKVARDIIRRVPIRWAIATILLYALAVPLYLSKVIVPPADAYWLFTPLFILVIYPTRLLMGWVYGIGTQTRKRRSRLIRWPAKVFMVPLLGLYSLILFAVPLISEKGPRAMIENHAFLLPAPSGEFK